MGNSGIFCEGGTMGSQDIGLKSYLEDTRRYADLWNGGVFEGRQMIHPEELEELELKRLVPEYPLHFLDLAEFHHFEYFKTELRPLFELYQRRNSQKNFMNYIKTDGMCQSMDEESWYMLSQMTHSKDLSKLIEEKKQRKGKGKTMCKAIEDLKNEGRAEGRAESIIDLLEDCGTVSDDLKRRIMEEDNFKVLKSWLKLAVRVKNVEEFVACIS